MLCWGARSIAADVSCFNPNRFPLSCLLPERKSFCCSARLTGSHQDICPWLPCITACVGYGFITGDSTDKKRVAPSTERMLQIRRESDLCLLRDSPEVAEQVSRVSISSLARLHRSLTGTG